MLFNSFEFIFGLLPATLILFVAARRFVSWHAALLVIIAASLFFYGWWNPIYIPLILGSVCCNFSLGLLISNDRAAGGMIRARVVTTIGVVANLSLLGYFKYSAFFFETVNDVGGTSFLVRDVALPLAISFFTFQQIAYLVDTYQAKVSERDPLKYAVFVLFFPQLIAGPIVHHSEMLPQFEREKDKRYAIDNLSLGLTIFVIGLFKKVCIADTMADYANPVFAAGQAGESIELLTAWSGALAYTFQLYFDFSGYSDMAVGLARMFGIVLPVNFFSPYKAVNIVDFWRRWHMTLSRFLRDYIYIPLGGNRRGPTRRYVNLLTTMILGGLWHGAGWTFILWGAMHGIMLVANHGWHRCRSALGLGGSTFGGYGQWLARLTTFFFVVLAWVMFRAESLDAAKAVYAGMFGLHGLDLPIRVAAATQLTSDQLAAFGIRVVERSARPMIGLYGGLAVLGWIVMAAPNVYEITRGFKPGLISGAIEKAQQRATSGHLLWRADVAWGIAMGGVAAASIVGMLMGKAEFLYYEF